MCAHPLLSPVPLTHTGSLCEQIGRAHQRGDVKADLPHGPGIVLSSLEGEGLAGGGGTCLHWWSRDSGHCEGPAGGPGCRSSSSTVAHSQSGGHLVSPQGAIQPALSSQGPLLNWPTRGIKVQLALGGGGHLPGLRPQVPARVRKLSPSPGHLAPWLLSLDIFGAEMVENLRNFLLCSSAVSTCRLSSST